MSTATRTCVRCVMDTTDPNIRFDDDGCCDHCTAALERITNQLLPPGPRHEALLAMVEKIKAEGRNKPYDCVIGLSGGVDSTMTAYEVKRLGLRPLAVHFDNGWNSELAVSNIKAALDALNIHLVTHVVDWVEFRDLQLSFLRASVANCEVPTDHGIFALLFRTAARHRVRFILTGSNVATESIMPSAWGHYSQDLRHLRAIHKRFGSGSIKTLPTMSLFDYAHFVMVRRVRQIPFLNYIDYDKTTAKTLLAKELGWRDYGGKHYESVWTRFFQGHYLPAKFGFDKRKAHLSSMICIGAITREQALEELQTPIYPPDLLRQDLEFVMKKLGLTESEFKLLLQQPPKQASDYPSHLFLFHELRRWRELFRRIAITP